LDSDRLRNIYEAFYRVPRAGAQLLSDGGGPFGSDIHAAVLLDQLIEAYAVDGIFETGCCLGDTTDYLVRAYPRMPVWTCDINVEWASFTRIRLRDAPNLTVQSGDSAHLLAKALQSASIPLVYLDAHWDARWPLSQELLSIRRGVAVIDDFNIGSDRFGYDTYNGVECGPKLLRDVLGDNVPIFVPNLSFRHELPCLQVGRRGGRAYVPINLDAAPLAQCHMFVPLGEDADHDAATNR
jgi:hypothetical protein